MIESDSAGWLLPGRGRECCAVPAQPGASHARCLLPKQLVQHAPRGGGRWQPAGFHTGPLPHESPQQVGPFLLAPSIL